VSSYTITCYNGHKHMTTYALDSYDMQESKQHH